MKILRTHGPEFFLPICGYQLKSLNALLRYPAVSQISKFIIVSSLKLFSIILLEAWFPLIYRTSLISLVWKLTILCLKSMPVVPIMLLENSLSENLISKLDLPTPDSPRINSLI